MSRRTSFLDFARPANTYNSSTVCKTEKNIIMRKFWEFYKEFQNIFHELYLFHITTPSAWWNVVLCYSIVRDNEEILSIQ